MKTFPILIFTAIQSLAAIAAPWAGFVDKAAELRTESFTFGAANAEAFDSNENYYDGDFVDFDGDGLMDRGLGSRYGLLKNTGAGFMTPFAGPKYVNYLFRGFQPGWGEDAFQWADVDGDGDLDIVQGGNGEPFTLQINQAGRFRTKWTKSGSALNIVNIDIDKDGDVDFAVAHAFCSDALCGHGCPEGDCQGGTWPKEFHLWVNDGAGNFTDQANTRGFSNFGADLIVGVVAGDVDKDGDFDLMMINGIKRGITLAKNNGSGVFTLSLIPFGRAMAAIRPISSGFNQGMNLGDVDDDGDLDLVIALQRDTAGSPHPQVAHAIFINNGSGGFVEETATRFIVSGFTGFMSGGNGKLIDVDYDGDLDFFAFEFSAARHVQIFLNDGKGVFTYSNAFSKSLPGGEPGATTGADNDVTDLDGDGTYDVWIGAAGSDVHPLINSFKAADGLPANVPRNLIADISDGRIVIEWRHPQFADVARRYKVYRSTHSGLARRDWRLIKNVGYSIFQDEGFAAPITRHSTTASLNDSTVVLDGAAGTVRFVDNTAKSGVIYYYAVSHVGTENTESVLTDPVAASTPGDNGADLWPPYLDIVSPTTQDWSALPRIVAQYGDGESGIDVSSLRVSLNKPLGDPAAGGRASGSDISDIFFAKTTNIYVAALQTPLILETNSLVTLTVSVGDKAGNRITNQVQFFPLVKSVTPPVAAFSPANVKAFAGEPVVLSADASRDPDGKVFAYEWYFEDGSTAFGRTLRKEFLGEGAKKVTFLVRDAQGGPSVANGIVEIVPLRFTAMVPSAAGLTIEFPTLPGKTLVVESANALPALQWDLVQTFVGDGARKSLSLPVDATARFYRIRLAD